MSKVMEDVLTCGVCSEFYQTGTHDPLVLPCGHTFCKNCVTCIRRTSNPFLCPSCRKSHANVDVNRLLINYSLVGLSANYDEFQCESCKEHGDDLKYWCRDCQLPLCSLCLYSNHPPKHKVLLTKAYVQEKKDALQDQIKLINRAIGEKKSEVEATFCKCASGITSLCKKSATLIDLETDVGALSSEVQKAASIESVFICEIKVKSFMDVTGPLSVSRSIAESGKDEADSVHLDSAASAKNGVGETVDQQQLSASSNNTEDRRCSRLDFRDGRLLLHSVNSNVAGHLFLKLPSDVFLEISAKGRPLGRVYIHIETHLRRAQQFILFCLGTLGPSYIDASFGSFGRNNMNEKVVIWCTQYRTPDGKTGQNDALNQLEWGGAYSKQTQEGQVAAFNNNVGQHGFGIWVKSYGTSHCPIGQVSAGLEVVRAAMGHEPVSEVTITHCGLVVPDLVL